MQDVVLTYIMARRHLECAVFKRYAMRNLEKYEDKQLQVVVSEHWCILVPIFGMCPRRLGVTKEQA